MYMYKPSKLLKILDKSKRFYQAMSTVKFDVTHDPQNKEFYIQMQGTDKHKDKAFLQYEFTNKNTVDLYHTLVPPKYRGHGVAALLADAAFKHFNDANVKMHLSCSYLQHYASKLSSDQPVSSSKDRNSDDVTNKQYTSQN